MFLGIEFVTSESFSLEKKMLIIAYLAILSQVCVNEFDNTPTRPPCEELTEYDECNSPCIWTGDVPPYPPSTPS